MAEYIRFQTTAIPNKSEPSAPAVRAPALLPAFPCARSEVGGVIVDGAEIEFTDESSAERLHRAVFELLARDKEDLFTHCSIFSLLLAGSSVEGVTVRDFNEGQMTMEMKASPVGNVDVDRRPLGNIVVVHTLENGGFEHMAYPAHHADGDGYFQLLGPKGSIVFCGIEKTHEFYKTNYATTVQELTVLRHDDQGSSVAAHWDSSQIGQ